MGKNENRNYSTTHVANHSGPLSLCTNVQTLRELWPTWHFRGPCLHRPTLWKAFLCPECSLYTIAHQLAKVWALLYMLGVALGAMSSSGNTKVLSLLAIAQRLEARWPDSEGQRIDSQKSWSAKPLNGKQTCADIMSTNHHHSCCQPFRSTIIVYYRANSSWALTNLALQGPRWAKHKINVTLLGSYFLCKHIHKANQWLGPGLFLRIILGGNGDGFVGDAIICILLEMQI